MEEEISKLLDVSRTDRQDPRGDRHKWTYLQVRASMSGRFDPRWTDECGVMGTKKQVKFALMSVGTYDKFVHNKYNLLSRKLGFRKVSTYRDTMLSIMGNSGLERSVILSEPIIAKKVDKI